MEPVLGVTVKIAYDDSTGMVVIEITDLRVNAMMSAAMPPQIFKKLVQQVWPSQFGAHLH